MADIIRQYLSLVHRRPKFLLGIIALISLGVICDVLAYTSGLDNLRSSYRQLAGGFGDAFIIAAALAVLVDPVVQHQFASDWGRDLYWAIFSPNAPPTFRDAVQTLAAPTAFIKNCQYELEFTRPANNDRSYYEVTWHISVVVVVLDRRGFRLADTVFVVPRHDGTPTTYVQYRFQTGDEQPVNYDDDDLEAQKAVKVDDSGRTELHQDKIQGITRVGFGEQYTSERRLETSRWAADYLPLFQPRIVLEQSIIIRGDAVRELQFTIAQLGGVRAQFVEEDVRGSRRPQLRCHFTDVAFPGQATLVTWRPKGPAAELTQGAVNS